MAKPEGMKLIYEHEGVEVYENNDGLKFYYNGEFSLNIHKSIRAISGVSKMDKMFYDENGVYHFCWSREAIKKFYNNLVTKHNLIFKMKDACAHLIHEKII